MTSLDIAAGSVRSAAIMFDETGQDKVQTLLDEWGCWQPFVTIATGPHAAERGMACA